MKRTLLALGGVVIMLATGCGSSGNRTSASSTPATAGLLPTVTTTTPSTIPPTTTIPPSTTTTTVPDTSIVPSRITVPYVDAVLVKLNQVYGDALRTLVDKKKVTPAILVDLSAIYEPHLYAQEVNVFARGTGAGLSNVKAKPGNRRMTVVHLVSASSTCVFAKVSIDERSVDVHPPRGAYSTYEGLLVNPGISYKGDPNTTHWKFFADIALNGPEKVADACAGRGTNS